MPGRVRQLSNEEKIEQLTLKVGPIFNDASTTANQIKNNVALWKVHQEFNEIKEAHRRGTKILGEKAFQKEIQFQLTRVIPLKKATPVADRIIKFVAGYIKYINEKALEPIEGEEPDDEDLDDNPSSRFTDSTLKFLLQGFEAKDKNVRYRVLQTVASMIAHLGAIDEGQYEKLRGSLMDRLQDKESVVRLQAVVALSKLCDAEDAANLNGITQQLLQCMAYDASLDVRKAVLLNIPVTSDTLDGILDRTKDTEAAVRKLVYEPVLRSNLVQANESVIGPSHPRALSLVQRELITKNGLGDRDPTVRKVAATLLASWVDYAHIGEEGSTEAGNDDNKRIEDNVLRFLKLFDLGLKEGEAAASALKSIFQTRQEIFDNVEFDGKYWTDITPEKVFLARVFVDYCKEEDDNARLEAAIPVVTQMAFYLQESYNALQDLDPPETLEGTGLSEEELLEKEEVYTAMELILGEFLRIAANLDYADEIGRRKMDMLTRDMVRKDTLSTKLMGPCLAVIRALTRSERDLILLIVEIIQDLRDAAYGENEEPPVEPPEPADGDQSFEEERPPPSPARKRAEDMPLELRHKVEQTDIRCLSLCISMLEQVDDTMENNVTLDGLLKDLIVPSLTSQNDDLKELGLKSLGLCCLIAKPLAKQSIAVLMQQIPSGSQRHKIVMVQSLFDICMVHEAYVFKDQPQNVETLTAFLVDHIRQEQDPIIKAIFCEGTAKLILSGLIKDVDVVKNLIKAYVSPATADNQELRQCLAYFLQVYGQSSPGNQRRMREMFVHVFLDICQDRKEAEEEEEEDEIVPSVQIANMFFTWTDPNMLNTAMTTRGGQGLSDQEHGVQLDLAEDILRTLFEKDLKVTIKKEDKRVLCQLLNSLHIPDKVDDRKIQSIKLLIDHLRHRRPLKDSVCNNALNKFEATIVKKFEKQLENLNEEEFRELEELNELFLFLDSIIPLDEDEDIDLEPVHKGKKRRSESMVTATATEDEDFPGSPPPGKGKGKRKVKRARFSTSDGDDTSTQRGSVPPPKPTRTLPKRAAAGKKKIEPIVITSDSEDAEATPAPSRKANPKSRPKSVKEEEAQLDAEISGLLAPPTTASSSTSSTRTFDSIMDDSDEEDEDEVISGLLAEE